ncbi:epsin-2 isoform X1 [Neopelma chrysocephalum]|uniref:Epsin-2 isoform X1 n=1 Tax=Lepidothrix coronata TaxID=321398 RepID=A0A6J0HW50_9PASS|nr:PREDICTED: epsin-2 isoform X1 [Lepidothrix coronata]XP_017678683.1 PREDICTED: epsin-2 isoform X1 [Lepidothrix coronata]XP_017678684.1 PREDICTED: epsin-2 isoform X1 [Lepidothrix coronata]XP_017678686.1 PREDICTED: epsin-2 isoform X1 [Lepidothrix coronata]XP_017678687.1 PREDICTED: epsin-2 isoform X1 [Lepidothrix coronata]XP_027512330.1 epsin-2 isoform X1 [Corapipo altera]XP_027512331.1 epsin-2 isoform X1 [Corapipo altera]XP_027512332.1 epsin-2 isoform X1 [Corapipo altera]XP_027512333.1 epsi
MTTSSIRRQMKNIVNNYSEAEIKVREATSNDPWGPSSSLMTEIADLTYNVVAFSEIMSMIWKRLNDHGKNWRHVYKALTLLDYLIKTGSERVAQQCKENIFAIQTLKDFQYIDRDGKDQGINVREKSKQLVSLLKDDERLKTERAQALKTKERMAQVATGVGSNQITFGRGSSQPNLSTSYSEQEYGKSGGSPASYHGSTSPRVSSELEQARPQTSGEEELQLQLALAMSREVAEQVGAREERLRRGDDLRLQMALEESRRDTIKIPKKKEHTTLLDLMDALPSSAPAPPKTEPWGPPAVANQTDPWGGSTVAAPASDPWQSFGAKPAASVDPWAAPAGSTAQPLSKNDPWAPAQSSSTAAKPSVDPWGPAPANKPLSTSGSTSFDLFSNLNGTVKDDFSEFDTLRTSKKPAESGSTLPSQHSGTTSPDLFDSQHSSGTSGKQSAARKTPESFLGPNAALVNLDSLVSKPPQPVTSLNPFLAPGAATAPTPINPFQVNQPQPLTLNQMRASPVMGTSPSFSAVPPMSMEPIPLSSMAPVPVGMAPLPAMGTVASITRMGQGLSIAGSMPQPLHSTGIPPSASQSANTTNPFLL